MIDKNNYIDRWCATHIRKVAGCKACLHYKECLAAGQSIVESAQEHAKLSSKTSYNFSEDLAKALGFDPYAKDEDDD